MSIDAFFNLNLIFQRMTYSLDVLHQGGVLICFNSTGDQVERDCLQRAISCFKDLPFDMGLVISTSSVAQVDLKCLDFYFTIYKLLCTY